MALSLEKTVRLILKGEDRVSEVLNQVGRNVDSFADRAGRLNQSVGDVTAPFASLASGVLKADAALAALAAGGLAYAFKQSKDFEAASIELQKVLGDEIDQLGQAQTAARSMSMEYGESARDVLLSTAAYKQAGFDLQSSMQLSKNALDLVIAGDLEAAKASEILIAALKGFDAPASEAARLIDILNEVSNNYATDVEQLAVGMAGISPIAKTMGFTMEETAGVLTPVIEIFRSGDEAATALKTGLLRLVDDNPTIVRALESIGVSQRDANGSLRNGKDILSDVAQAFTGLDQNQKLFIASQLVGIQQAARMVTVFDNLGKTSEITATALSSAGSAALEVKARLESADVAVNRFVVGFDNLASNVGDQFRAAAVAAIDGGTAITRALDEAISSGAMDPLFDSLRGRLQDLGAFLAEVAEQLPAALAKTDFTGIVDAFNDLGLEVGDLFGDVDLTTAEGLSAAVQKISDAIEALIRVTSGMVSGTSPFIDWLISAADRITDLEDGTHKSIGEITGFGAALNKVSGLAGGVIDAVGGIGSGLQALAGVHLVKAIAGLVGKAGLASALTSTTTAAAGLLAKMVGPAGVIAVVGGSGLAVAGAVKGYIEMREAQDDAASASDRAAKSEQNLTGKLADLSAQTGIQIDSTRELQRLIEDGTLVVDKQTGTLKRATEVQRDYASEVEAARDAGYDWNEVVKQITDESGNLIGAVSRSSEAIDDNKEAAIAARAAFYQLQGNTPELARAMAELEQGAITPAAESMEKTKEATEDLQKTMLELASDERIRSMELNVDFKIAQIEAETARMKTAFESVDNVITDTGQSLRSFVSDLVGIDSSDLNSIQKSNAVERQIKEENRRRDEALELERRLTETQIERAEIMNRKLRNGDTLIKLEASGLEPHLEAIWYEVLKVIQIRANEEEAEFLLGI